jgi:DNA mismatch repair protein MSH6
MIESWLTAPLLKISAIKERQDAIQDLMGLTEVTAALRLRSKGSDAGGNPRLSSLPDLERLLSRVHSLGSKHREDTHPESRAVMYETPKYDKNKIMAFASVLNGFKQALKIVAMFKESMPSIKSPLLRRILTVDDGSNSKHAVFPDVADALEHFDKVFDAKQAKQTGTIEPRRGNDAEYDDAMDAQKDIIKRLDAYLREQKRAMNCSSIKYFLPKKDPYQLEVSGLLIDSIDSLDLIDPHQLEVPESAVKRGEPDEYELKSKKKGFKRYYTPTIRGLLAELVEQQKLAEGEWDEWEVGWGGGMGWWVEVTEEVIAFISHIRPILAPQNSRRTSSASYSTSSTSTTTNGTLASNASASSIASSR